VIGPAAGAGEAAQAPLSVRFATLRYTSSPAFHMMVSRLGSPPGIGGLGLERKWHAYIRQVWITAADSPDDTLSDKQMKQPRILPPPHGPAAQDPHQSTRRIEQMVERLYEVSTAAGVPLVARLPEDDEDGHPYLEPVGQRTLSEYWKQLWRGNLMVKWHDGVQICSTETWPMEDPPVPLSLVGELRKDAKPGELLPLADLETCADLLTPSQLARLKTEFPVMAAVARTQAILAFLHRNPALATQAMSDSGLHLTPESVRAIRSSFPPTLMEVVDRGDATIYAASASQILRSLRQSRNPRKVRRADRPLVPGVGCERDSLPIPTRPAHVVTTVCELLTSSG